MVHLTSSSLNSLAEFVRKAKPTYDSILNYSNDLEEEAIESYSIGSEMPVVQPPPGCIEMQDAVSPHSDQQTRSLPAPSGIDHNDTAFCNKVVAGESGLSAMKNILPKHESTAGSDGPKTVSAAILAQYNRDELFRKVWSASLPAVAKELGVACTTLIRVCKQLHIPIPPRGYWMQSPMNRAAVQQPALPVVRVVGGGTVKGEVSGEIPKVSALLLSRYDREELYRKAWQKPLMELAQELGMTRDAIAMKCRQLYIPIPGHFYWQRTARLDEKDWPPLPAVESFGFVKIAKKWKRAVKATKP